MGLLTRVSILEMMDLPVEIVQVPEWGGEVAVRGLSGAERDRFEMDSVERKGRTTEVNLANLRARLVAKCVVDEDGKRIFSDADAEWLGDKSAVALNRVFEAARRLSGLNAEDVQELTKN